MDRQVALREARRLAEDNHWGSEKIGGETASFFHDSETQAFIEIEGGGKPAFADFVRAGWVQPYLWSVRRFRAGDINQVTVRFTPAGTPFGFSEQLSEDAPGRTLTNDAARKVAEDAARGEPWHIDLKGYTLVETSQHKFPGGRVDHTFTYENLHRLQGEGRLRMSLTIGGDRLTGLSHFVIIPEGFARRFTKMRSANALIANAAGVLVVVGYLFVGCGAGLLYLLRRKLAQWRQALVCSAVFTGVLLAAEFNRWPLLWQSYDTAQSTGSFVAHTILILFGGAAMTGAILFLVLMVAEGLTRRAFPSHPQFWKLAVPGAAASTPILGRVLVAYLLTPFWLVFTLLFSLYSTKSLGWWMPLETTFDPDALTQWVPWFAPFSQALQAGFLEEILFRALPLAGAAILGERFGGRRLWIGAALVAQAVVFGCAHAVYPQQPAYSRVVELMVPSLMLGALYLRLGLLTPMLVHFLYDLSLMALPLFAMSSRGIWLDRAMVILLISSPLGLVLWHRCRTGARGPLEATFLNFTWKQEGGPRRPVVAANPPPMNRTPSSIGSPARLTILGAAGVVGAAAFVFSSFLADGSRLKLHLVTNRAEAEIIARASLAERKMAIPDPINVMSRVVVKEDPAYRFVWQMAGRRTYESLIKGPYLRGPYWFVRFARFQGDVAERAEEWDVDVSDGRVGVPTHMLPEARSGERLTEGEARTRALAALERKRNLTAVDVREVSAAPSNLVHRTDWMFVFRRNPVDTRPQVELRDRVAVVGGEVAGLIGFVFVPESWERAQLQLATYLGSARIVGNLAMVLLAVAFTVAAAFAWSGKRFETRAAIVVGAVAFIGRLADAANQWPVTASRFLTDQPLVAQRTMALLRALVVGPLFFAVILALFAGLALAWIRASRSTPLSCPAVVISGLYLGCAMAGTVGLLGLFHAKAEPTWPSFYGAQAFWPMASTPLSAVTDLTRSTVIGLLFVAAFDRFNIATIGRRLLWSAVAFLVGMVFVQDGSASSVGTWAASAILGGAAVLLVYAFALRHRYQLVPAMLGAERTLHLALEGAARAYPAALPSAVVAILLVLIVTGWWAVVLRRTLADDIRLLL